MKENNIIHLFDNDLTTHKLIMYLDREGEDNTSSKG